MNNFEEVQKMTEGTIFQFVDGAPWMRVAEGVVDLIPDFPHVRKAIPERWKTYNFKLNTLYRPDTDE